MKQLIKERLEAFIKTIANDEIIVLDGRVIHHDCSALVEFAAENCDDFYFMLCNICRNTGYFIELQNNWQFNLVKNDIIVAA